MDDSQQTRPYVTHSVSLVLKQELTESSSVRRSELRSPSASPGAVSPSEELKLQWQQQICQVYTSAFEVDAQPDNAAAKAIRPPLDPLDEETYDFRLFSGKAKTDHPSSQQISKVRIESPTPVTEEPGFVHPRRSEDYYFTRARSDVERRRYEEATVDGEQVLKESRAKWPGFELPWRVTHITERNAPRQSTQSTTLVQVTAPGRRKRNGKKKRIAIRLRTRAQNEREALLKRTKADKEALESEKRNRRNREKKIKRREKARAMKKGTDD
ncbi:MAG: hypothetical protein Q9173_002835 [Seirophora scorigena]